MIKSDKTVHEMLIAHTYTRTHNMTKKRKNIVGNDLDSMTTIGTTKLNNFTNCYCVSDSLY